MDASEQQSLAEWADRVVALEREVCDGVLAGALRLAGDKRLPQADRDFAQAQADAIRRALRRVKSKNPKNRRR